MRMLGVDYGDARIGIATCDELEILATARDTITSQSMRKNIDAVAAIAQAEKVERIVVGLPLNMDGTEGARVSKTRSFGKVLEKVSGIEVVFFDERLTTVEADERMDEAQIKKSKRKGIVDRIAAAIILQSYLDYYKKSKQGEQL